MPLNKPWQTVTGPDDPQLADVVGTLGVYEIADEAGNVLYIGKADPRVAFGLRQAISAHFNGERPVGPAAAFRLEVTSSYYSRWVDLLMRYCEDNEELPPGNQPEAPVLPTLGRFHWKSVTA